MDIWQDRFIQACENLGVIDSDISCVSQDEILQYVVIFDLNGTRRAVFQGSLEDVEEFCLERVDIQPKFLIDLDAFTAMHIVLEEIPAHEEPSP